MAGGNKSLNPMDAKFFIKLSDVLVKSGIVFWFIETAYFGFNLKPSCHAEAVCDKIAMVAITAAVLVRIEVVCQAVISKLL